MFGIKFIILTLKERKAKAKAKAKEKRKLIKKIML